MRLSGVRKLAADVADGKVTPDEINEILFENYLDTARSAGSGSSDPHQRESSDYPTS